MPSITIKSVTIKEEMMCRFFLLHDLSESATILFNVKEARRAAKILLSEGNTSFLIHDMV